MPRASFRSVLLRIAANAALTWRASRHTTSKPAACSPYVRYWVSAPASKPTVSIWPLNLRKQPTIRCSSAGTFASYRTSPVSSTMQIDTNRSDTSKAVKYVISLSFARLSARFYGELDQPPARLPMLMADKRPCRQRLPDFLLLYLRLLCYLQRVVNLDP